MLMLLMLGEADFRREGLSAGTALLVAVCDWYLRPVALRQVAQCAVLGFVALLAFGTLVVDAQTPVHEFQMSNFIIQAECHKIPESVLRADAAGTLREGVKDGKSMIRTRGPYRASVVNGGLLSRP
jgi:hypothetical protein